LEEILGEEVSGDRLVVNANSFFGEDKMWRCIESCFPGKTCPLSVDLEKRLDECTCASFSLGTGDMDDIEFINTGSLSSLSGVQDN